MEAALPKHRHNPYRQFKDLPEDGGSMYLRNVINTASIHMLHRLRKQVRLKNQHYSPQSHGAEIYPEDGGSMYFRKIINTVHIHIHKTQKLTLKMEANITSETSATHTLMHMVQRPI
jgi:hypothetical protein